MECTLRFCVLGNVKEFNQNIIPRQLLPRLDRHDPFQGFTDHSGTVILGLEAQGHGLRCRCRFIKYVETASPDALMNACRVSDRGHQEVLIVAGFPRHPAGVDRIGEGEISCDVVDHRSPGIQAALTFNNLESGID